MDHVEKMEHTFKKNRKGGMAAVFLLKKEEESLHNYNRKIDLLYNVSMEEKSSYIVGVSVV